MKKNQLTRGQSRRVMYVENKDGDIDGASARIGWVAFSKSGLTVYYRGRTLQRAKGGGVRGNYLEPKTGNEYWISGLKNRGSNRHPAERGARVVVDEDARSEFEKRSALA